jgi:hypothetical protein
MTVPMGENYDLQYTDDCKKCGGEVLTDGYWDYRCNCSYPDDCPIQRLNDWRFYEDGAEKICTKNTE